MSEAMSALGVATTRSLAVVTTGETVFREYPTPGAVVTRVASSHIRVGTFQYFAARGDIEGLKALTDYTIERHYPELLQTDNNRYLMLIDQFMDRFISLVVDWMRVGFIHGVMNTDNTALSGETIDYGPCAMMGIYDPATVYSSIDVQGRYAFGNQPEIAQWNTIRFAECLLPLIDENNEKAVAVVTELVHQFTDRFRTKYMEMLGLKFGLATLQQGDDELLFAWMKNLQRKELDYTRTFDQLTHAVISSSAADNLQNKLGDLFESWQQRIEQKAHTKNEIHKLMRASNPVVIPRNHHVEAAIKAVEQEGDLALTKQLLSVLRSPYQELDDTYLFQSPPEDGDANYQTFCGT
jgi:uncharacterized protein YdiU (UPF0061 family)